jgi:hypothetical protein
MFAQGSEDHPRLSVDRVMSREAASVVDRTVAAPCDPVIGALAKIALEFGKRRPID